MEPYDQAEKEASLTRKAIDIAIRLSVLALLLVWCFQILRPFVSPVVWGIILAIAVYPVFKILNMKLGNRRKLTATVLVLSALLILIVPSVQLTVSSVDSLQTLKAKLEAEKLRVPPPPEGIGSWFLIGKHVESVWQKASENLESTLMKFEPQIIAFAKWLLNMFFETTVGLLMFAVSLIIAGVFMASAEKGEQMSQSMFIRLAGDHGARIAETSVKTVRSVVKGIIGVSIIQSLLAGLGFFVSGIPFAGLWAFLCLILAIIQIGIGPVIFPVIIYAFLKLNTITAVILTIWLVLLAIADGPMKASIMGRGASVPMLVIFLGSIGGFIYLGFLGLFIGAVVLSVGYNLFEFWLHEQAQSESLAKASETVE